MPAIMLDASRQISACSASRRSKVSFGSSAQLLHGKPGPIWFFTSHDNAIVRKLGSGHRAISTFTSKNHDLFATVHGSVAIDNDRATLDALWNRYVAAWFEHGKDAYKPLGIAFCCDKRLFDRTKLYLTCAG